MKYFLIALIIPALLYLFSYIKYSWRKNRFSAIGSIILGILSIVIPVIVFFIR